MGTLKTKVTNHPEGFPETWNIQLYNEENPRQTRVVDNPKEKPTQKVQDEVIPRSLKSDIKISYSGAKKTLEIVTIQPRVMGHNFMAWFLPPNHLSEAIGYKEVLQFPVTSEPSGDFVKNANSWAST